MDWDRLERLLEDALALPPDEREDFLEEACGSDHALRMEVVSLIGHAESRGRFLATSPAEEPVTGPIPEPPDLPSSLGPYRLVEKLGEGGMGEVWLARQVEPVERYVAVKIIKLGMDTRRILARFQAERQVLAVMDHPAIARLLGAGSTAEGRPYFVMEVIRGEPITRFADQRQLSVRKRVELIVDVCGAIDHAHRRDVIHRDIKPSNLLVSADDAGRLSVKVIDFGIAKAVHPSVDESSDLTRTGQVLGTPDYASPEQIGAIDAPVDHRTDVFSLGVVLYELLTGGLPWASGAAGLAALSRRSSASHPPVPSEHFTASDTQVTLAAARSSTPRALRRELRGDLDCVALRALATSPEDRYATVAALAEDLERYLRGERVLARPTGPVYPLKLLARRWGRVAAVAAGGALLLFVPALRPNGPDVVPSSPVEDGAPEVGGSPSYSGPIRAPAALVANMDDGTVSVVDLTSHRELGTIPAGEDPQDFVITPDGRTAFVTDRGSDRILAIDLDSGTSSWMASPGRAPQGIDITPDGRTLYVANIGDDEVRVIHLEPEGYRMGARIPVGGEPFRVRVSPDGSRVYVPNPASDDMSVIDVASNTVIDTIDQLRTPFHVAISPDGATAWVTTNASGEVAVVDLPEGTIVDRIVVGPAPEGVQFSPDGRHVWVANQGSGTVSVIDAASRRVVAEVRVGDTPQHIVFTPDGAFAYVPNAASGDVSVVDVAELRVVHTVPVGAGTVGIALVNPR